jgi:hypothetical protein
MREVSVTTYTGENYTFEGPTIYGYRAEKGTLLIENWVRNGRTGTTRFAKGMWCNYAVSELVPAAEETTEAEDKQVAFDLSRQPTDTYKGL